MTPFQKWFRSFMIACAGLFYDVRITRSGKVYFRLRDKKERHKALKKARALRK